MLACVCVCIQCNLFITKSLASGHFLPQNNNGALKELKKTHNEWGNRGIRIIILSESELFHKRVPFSTCISEAA